MDGTNHSANMLRIELLGLPRLVLPSGEIHVLERRDAALLAWLVLQGPTPRSRLVSLLWPDASTRAAQTNLRQRLFRLKQRSGREMVLSGPVMSLAEGIEHDLGLGPASITRDGDGATISRPLLGSLQYDDAGELGEWVAAARERRSSERQRLLAECAQRLESDGRIADALVASEQLVAELPTAEHAHRRVMRLHYRRGDRAAALAAYERCRVALRNELATTPSDETRRLASTIERSEALVGVARAPAPTPVTVLRPPRLVGRSTQWAAMQQAWAGRRPILVTGEPGIGKSRLLDDFARAQRVPIRFSARAGDSAAPYTSLSNLIRVVLERSDARGARPEREVARLLGRVHAARSSPLLPMRLAREVDFLLGEHDAVLFDDLHHADEATLELLVLLLRTERRWLLGMRDTGASPALDAWLSHAGDDAVSLVELSPLDAGGVAELLETIALPNFDAAELAPRLISHTGGNPLFLVETLDALVKRATGITKAEPLPHSRKVTRLIEERLQRLSPEALRLAQTAALCATDFDVELAGQVLDTHPLALTIPWQELEGAHVFRGLRFAHDLVAEVALRLIPSELIRTMHRRIAAALERVEGAVQAHARIAQHWQAGADMADAARQFEAAAEHAQRNSRAAEALSFWVQAVACHTKADDRAGRFRALLGSIDPALTVEPSAAVIQRIRDAMDAAPNDSARLDVLLKQGKQFLCDADWKSARAPVDEALELAQRLRDHTRETAAIGWKGLVLALEGHKQESLEMFEQRADAARAGLDVRVRLDFFGAYGYALHVADRFAASVVALRQAQGDARELHDWSEEGVQTGNLMHSLLRLGDRAAGMACCERIDELWRLLGEPVGVDVMAQRVHTATVFAAAGRYGKALEMLEGALAQFRVSGARMRGFYAENFLASLFVALGRPTLARQTLTPPPTAADDMNRLHRLGIEARIARAGSGRAPVDALAAGLKAPPYGASAVDIAWVRIELALCLRAEQAAPMFAQAVDEATRASATGLALQARTRYADVLRQLGEVDRAADLMEAVIRDAREVVPYGLHDLHAPEFWWLASQALDAAGRHEAALAAAREGVEFVERCSRDHVPAVFVESFRSRNPVHRSLLSRCARPA